MKHIDVTLTWSKFKELWTALLDSFESDNGDDEADEFSECVRVLAKKVGVLTGRRESRLRSATYELRDTKETVFPPLHALSEVFGTDQSTTLRSYNKLHKGYQSPGALDLGSTRNMLSYVNDIKEEQQVFPEKVTWKEFACKSIAKRKLITDNDVEDLRLEIEIMHHLPGHPNVVSIQEVYEDFIPDHL
nr:calcium-dependent protein kinase 1 [Tanacetum cinerariifolium]